MAESFPKCPSPRKEGAATTQPRCHYYLLMSLLARSSLSSFCSTVISSGTALILLSLSSSTHRELSCFRFSAFRVSIWFSPACNSYGNKEHHDCGKNYFVTYLLNHPISSHHCDDVENMDISIPFHLPPKHLDIT